MPNDITTRRPFGDTAKRNLMTPEQVFANQGRIPPQATDLEEVVLGALMLEKDAVNEVIDILSPEAFYLDKHQKIFAAIKALFGKSEPIDILTVTNELKQRGELEMVGGAYYISKLTLMDLLQETGNICWKKRKMKPELLGGMAWRFRHTSIQTLMETDFTRLQPTS